MDVAPRLFPESGDSGPLMGEVPLPCRRADGSALSAEKLRQENFLHILGKRVLIF